MRILLTNDDGIDAEGLTALRDIAASLSDDVWVVAPMSNQSGVSHSLTLQVPLRVKQHEKQVFSVSGTPTDCVLMGVLELMEDKKPDLLISGVNDDQNAADDVTYSGTIAGAIEGTLLGIPSIAMSQRRPEKGVSAIDWSVCRHHGAKIISRLLKEGWSTDIFFNINYPDCSLAEVKGVRVTEQGQRNPNLLLRYDKRIDMQNDPYYWLFYRRDKGNPPEETDLGALRENYISVSPLHLDMTHQKTVDALKGVFSPKQ